MRKFEILNIFKLFLNRLNHNIARKNRLNYPQLVILSFDHIGLKINLDGRYENHLLEYLEKFIKQKIPNSRELCVLDIGANIGNHSIFFSDLFETVYSFEPNPLTYEVLKINSKYACDRKNIKAFKLGISNKNKKVYFRNNLFNSGNSSIISEEDFNKNKNNAFKVDVVSLDNIDLLEGRKIGLIKIDIEGHELNALKGAENLIKKHKPIIFFEQEKKVFKNGRTEVINYLSTLGYIFYQYKKSFYFGETKFKKYLTHFLNYLNGNKMRLTRTTKFTKKYHELIIAVNT